MTDALEAFDLGNAQHVQQRNKAIRVTTNNVRAALRKLLDTKEGQIYLGWLLHDCQPLLAIDSPAEPQFWLGKRAIGVKLMDDARALDLKSHSYLMKLLTGAFAVEKAIAEELAKPKDEDNGRDTDDDE